MKRKVISFVFALIMCMGLTMTVSAKTSVNINGKEIKAPSGCEIVTDGVTVSDMIIVRQIKNSNSNAENIKYGVMNTDGTLVVPLIYDRICEFSEGLAAVYESTPYQYELPGTTVIVRDSINKIGFIDKTGNLVIPMIYEQIYSTTMIKSDDDTGIGHIKSPGFSEGLISVKKEGKWGVIDKQGNTAIPFQYDFPVIGSFHNGLASFVSGGKCGFINSSGEVVISPRYDSVDDFSDGYAIVANNNPASQDGDYLYGAIDTQGNLIVPIQYDYMSRFREGMARVSDKPFGSGKYGFVNTSGNLIVPIQYTKAYSFFDGLAVVAVEDERFSEPVFQNRYGYIDKQGNVVIPLEYSLAYSFSNGIGKACLNVPDHIGNNTSAKFDGKPEYVYFDTNGNKVTSQGN